MSADRVSKPDSEGWIHLHVAAAAGSLKCLKVLVKGMADQRSTLCCSCDVFLLNKHCGYTQ